MTPADARIWLYETYCEYRQWGEDIECAALRTGVSPETAREFEAQRLEGAA